MSLYNAVMGFNQSCYYVAPLVVGHPQNNVPRFRDCFLKDGEHPEYDGKIQIYARIGGYNRKGYVLEIERLRKIDGYITDYDDSFDNTYASFVYEVPEKYKSDIEYYLNGEWEKTSNEYRELIINTFPKIGQKLREAFDKIPLSKLKQ